MPNIFVHALEGKPDDPKFQGKSERDIRVRWLVTMPEGAPVGTGPWLPPDTIFPDKIVLKRNPKFPKTKPEQIDEVHLPFIADGFDLAERLERAYGDPRGHVDFAPTVTEPSTFHRLQQNPDIRVRNIPCFNIFYLGFRFDLMNSNDRDAVIQVIDVDKYVPHGQGAADPAKNPVPPYMHGHDPNLHQKHFNPPHAREFKTVRTSATLVYTSASTYAKLLADAVADDIRNYLGWNVKKQDVPTWGDLVQEVLKGQPDMFIYSWNQRESHPDDPYDFLIPLFHSSKIGTTNLTRYRNSNVDGWLKGPSTDQHKAQMEILNDVPMVFLSHFKRKAAYNKRVKHLRLNNGALDEDRLINVEIVP